jgi:hypothetical protein
LHTILGDAAAARPPLIPFNPVVRPRNRGRRTGRSLDRSPQRVCATPLEVLLIAERAALLAERSLPRATGTVHRISSLRHRRVTVRCQV